MGIVQPAIRNQPVAPNKRRTLVAARRRKRWVLWLFLVPALISFGVYTTFPVIRSIYISLTNYRFAQIGDSQFIGFGNYITALTDPVFLSGIAKGFAFLLLMYAGGIIVPLLVALLADRITNEKASGVYRVILYLPAVIPGPMVFAMWMWIYNPSSGLANYLLDDVLGLGSPGWLSDPTQALLAVALMDTWWGLGQMTVFLLVGLQAIPRELYESARIDGAGELRVAWHITLPLLTPTIVTWAILKISNFAVVVEVLILQGAGDSLMTWARYAWEQAFTGSFNASYAAAIGWLGGIGMLMMTGIVYLAFRRPLKAL